MKPAAFRYHAPANLDAALEMLVTYGGEARVLAGGQSLIPMMNFRLANPPALVDLNRIPTLSYIRKSGTRICIGAMTRQRAIEHDALIARELPLLREAISWVGHLPTRSRGTIGGSIAHADPSAELPLTLQALEGEVVARGPGGDRTIAADELLQGIFTTSLAPDEILTEVRLDPMPVNAGFAVEEFSRRRGDFAIVSVAAVLVREGTRCVKARIATGGNGPAPRRLWAVEETLERDGIDDTVLEAAAELACTAIEPASDLNASADFRTHLTRVLVGRALRRARALAK